MVPTVVDIVKPSQTPTPTPSTTPVPTPTPTPEPESHLRPYEYFSRPTP